MRKIVQCNMTLYGRPILLTCYVMLESANFPVPLALQDG